jgi:hypothetical protein
MFSVPGDKVSIEDLLKQVESLFLGSTLQLFWQKEYAGTEEQFAILTE